MLLNLLNGTGPKIKGGPPWNLGHLSIGPNGQIQKKERFEHVWTWFALAISQSRWQVKMGSTQSHVLYNIIRTTALLQEVMILAIRVRGASCFCLLPFFELHPGRNRLCSQLQRKSFNWKQGICHFYNSLWIVPTATFGRVDRRRHHPETWHKQCIDTHGHAFKFLIAGRWQHFDVECSTC